MIAVIISPLTDFFFSQYTSYAPLDIGLEVTAVLLGILSVWYAKKNQIAVYPTGMISTAIFVYLLYQWMLLGDMLINAYYFLMSAYGWFFWTRQSAGQSLHPIARVNLFERAVSVFLFCCSALGVYLIYRFFGMWQNWTAYVDTFTTAIFFVGMWLMARRKIEHWFFWITGNIISIPLYFYKGLTITSIQYIIFTIIAIYGFYAWKEQINSKHLKV